MSAGLSLVRKSLKRDEKDRKERRKEEEKKNFNFVRCATLFFYARRHVKQRAVDGDFRQFHPANWTEVDCLISVFYCLFDRW